MNPEAQACKLIDALFMQAGWHVCDVGRANIRELEAEVDTNLKRSQALRHSVLNKSFGV